MVDNKSLLDLGIKIVDRVSDAVIKVSKEKGLGTEIGTVGAVDNNNEKLLQKIIQTNDSTLIENNKFKVIVSGNQKIHDKVLDLIKN